MEKSNFFTIKFYNYKRHQKVLKNATNLRFIIHRHKIYQFKIHGHKIYQFKIHPYKTYRFKIHGHKIYQT